MISSGNSIPIVIFYDMLLKVVLITLDSCGAPPSRHAGEGGLFMCWASLAWLKKFRCSHFFSLLPGFEIPFFTLISTMSKQMRFQKSSFILLRLCVLLTKWLICILLELSSWHVIYVTNTRPSFPNIYYHVLHLDMELQTGAISVTPYHIVLWIVFKEDKKHIMCSLNVTDYLPR